MKKIIYSIFGLGLIIFLTSCEAEEFVRPTIELQLSTNTIDLNLSMVIPSSTVSVMQGNKEDIGYTVESSDESVAIATIKGVEITITAVSEGTAVITVKDSHGMSDTVEVNVMVDLPTVPTFNWNGQRTVFDRAGGYGITILSNKIALTDILNDNVQYILSWNGDLTEGEKTNGRLRKIGQNIEPEEIGLPLFTVLRANGTDNYITFSNGEVSGELFFNN